jgi:hypothetical protein
MANEKVRSLAVRRRESIIRTVAAQAGERKSVLMRCIDIGIPAEMLSDLVETANMCGAKNKAHFAMLKVRSGFTFDELAEVYEAKTISGVSATKLCQLLERFPEIPLEADEIAGAASRIHDAVGEEFSGMSVANVLNIAEAGRFISLDVVLEYIDGTYWPKES